MKNILLLTLSFIFAGCASAPKEKEMIYVGYIKRDCSEVLNSNAIPAIPIEFKISPAEAAKSLPKGCFIKFFYSIYADNKNYYFADNNKLFLKSRSASNIRESSFVVSGTTGELVASP